jgi:enterochelin esterase family protein
MSIAPHRPAVFAIAILTAFASLTAAGESPTHSAASPDSSQTIASVRKQIQSSPEIAERKFWASVHRNGAPLIEPVPGEKDYSFVTFLWHGDSQTRNVVIFDGVAGFDAKDRMTRIDGTDVWYKTYRVRNDARFAYNLSPNDSLESLNDIKTPEAMKRRLTAFQVDPLNPRHCPTTFGEYGTESSWVQLPNAPPFLWTLSLQGVARGRLEQTTIHSALLNRDKKLWIYTPPRFQPHRREYPLLVLFDGDRNSMWMPKVLDLMIARHQIPALVAVMTDESTPSIRNSELPCNQQFADFLAQELVPWMRTTYGAGVSARQTIVAGSSYGGLASVFAGIRHPEVFGSVISLSGSFFWKPDGDFRPEWLTQQVSNGPRLPLHFYLEVGLMEGQAMEIDTNRRMAEALKAKGYPMGYAEFDGGHSYLTWSQGMVNGLTWLAHAQAASGGL